MKTTMLRLLAATAILALSAPLMAQDIPQRAELKRTDLTGAPGMEVINSIVTIEPGQSVGPHFHHGVESLYVIEGTMVQYGGKEPVMMASGTSNFNLREAMHGNLKVVGPKALKIFTVHIVDKGRPLYDAGK
jgi:quercetin dioxygenase-like cupin family protein